MASNSQNGQSTVAEDPFLQSLADAPTSTSDSSYPDPESVMAPYCYPEPGSIKAPRPAGTSGLGSSGSTVGGKDPTTCPFVCGLCGGRFTRRRTVKAHFPRCAMKNGNPRGLGWDSDPSCDQTGPATDSIPAAQSQNGFREISLPREGRGYERKIVLFDMTPVPTPSTHPELFP